MTYDPFFGIATALWLVALLGALVGSLVTYAILGLTGRAGPRDQAQPDANHAVLEQGENK